MNSRVQQNTTGFRSLSGDHVFTGFLHKGPRRGGLPSFFPRNVYRGCSHDPPLPREIKNQPRWTPATGGRGPPLQANRQTRRIVETETRSLVGAEGARGGRARTGIGGIKAIRSPGEIGFRFWEKASTLLLHRAMTGLLADLPPPESRAEDYCPHVGTSHPSSLGSFVSLPVTFGLEREKNSEIQALPRAWGV